MDVEYVALNNNVKACTRCDIGRQCTQKVISKGTYSTPIMFVGEAPGGQEDKLGIPFVGPAGILLDVLLQKHFNVTNSYFTNVVKCRPFRGGKNDKPTDYEVYNCNEYLRKEIELIKPKVIVCVGSVAANVLIHADFKITQEQGRWFQSDGIYKMAILHPSYILRQGENTETYNTLVKTVLGQVDTIKAKVDELCQSGEQ